MIDISKRSPVATGSLLRALGFRKDPEVLSDEPPGLSFNFGNFKLEAGQLMNRWLRPVITVGGVMTTDRTISLVHFEMPLDVESFEQGVALVTYCLDRHSPGGAFKPASTVSWLDEGRRYRHLLPWEKEASAYAVRPHCYVEREWARLALRDLSEILKGTNEDSPVIFQFDGEVLTIRCSQKVIAAPAVGLPWPNRFSISASLLQGLPQRLGSEVEVSVWDRKLQIGNRSYSGVTNFNMGEL